ncbi:hypothetical protein [Paraferrimonas haliotis]|uniref:Phage shock protein B n=1 Tax=Paraferrimonas haliotis TaxID=2013866 RepID=A0AA37TTH3_9GAMM|nr:hypothetical protein [Paraferrimonas haliotis]GLS84132.1 hypothetical protein GCM10007894_21090 [Paraferrimonas haliotis]
MLNWLVVAGFVGLVLALVAMQLQLSRARGKVTALSAQAQTNEFEISLLRQEVQELRSGTLGVAKRLELLESQRHD